MTSPGCAARAWLLLTFLPAVLGASLVHPPEASAHPLGDFSVNHYARLRVQPDAVRVDFVLDLAEVPSVPAREEMDRDGDGEASATERERYTGAQCRAYARELVVRLGGKRLPLAVTTTTLFLLPGQAGLRTVRVECGLAAAAPRGTAGQRLSFQDPSDPRRAGWREIVAVGEGTRLVNSTVPTRSRSAGLTHYPEDRLADPPQVRSARMRVADAAGGDVSRGPSPWPVTEVLPSISRATGTCRGGRRPVDPTRCGSRLKNGKQASLYLEN